MKLCHFLENGWNWRALSEIRYPTKTSIECVLLFVEARGKQNKTMK
jgi:hypothetical protein